VARAIDASPFVEAAMYDAGKKGERPLSTARRPVVFSGTSWRADTLGLTGGRAA
jgi:hypothetical protein